MSVLVRLIALALPWLLLPPASAQARADGPDHQALAPVMAGEFALQAGQLPEAARWYLQAARAEDDAGLAERATRIALLANEDARARDALALWRERAPQSMAMRGAEVALALRSGDIDAARTGLQALIADPDPQGWRRAYGVLGGGGRHPDLSAQLMGEMLDADQVPDTLEAWLVFGALAQGLGQPRLTERIVASAVQRFPEDSRIALLHARQLARANRAAEARVVLDRLLPQSAVDEALRLALAIEYDSLGEPAAAASVLGQGVQDTRMYGLRASLLAKAEDKTALDALYARLRADTSGADPERNLLLGQMAEYLERPEEALQWYAAVAGGPFRTEARLRSANVTFEAGRRQEAFAEVARLQGDATLDEDARRDAYLLEAELREKDEDPAGELDALARGLSAYPDDIALLYARGLAWERRDRIDRAEADLRRILVTDPENVPALNALGYTLADRTTRYQEALELIERARTADPDQAAIIDSYGWVLYRLGRHEEALVELRRAFTLMKDAEIAAHIGEVLWVTGREDEAREYFDRARELDPENRSLLRALEKTGA